VERILGSLIETDGYVVVMSVEIHEAVDTGIDLVMLVEVA
jgi:hypothetical protein